MLPQNLLFKAQDGVSGGGLGYRVFLTNRLLLLPWSADDGCLGGFVAV